MHTPLNLPKGYLSPHSIMCWLDNKQEFRRRYYGKDFVKFESIYTLFGSKIADMIEHNDPAVAFIPRHDSPEVVIRLDIDGVPMHGRLDSLCSKTFSFLDHKTTVNNKWTQKKVDELLQLDIYSVLVEEKYGKVNDECQLITIETKLQENCVEYNGHKFFGEKELVLTGNFVVYKRIINPERRKEIRDLIVRVATEISADYDQYCVESTLVDNSTCIH